MACTLQSSPPPSRRTTQRNSREHVLALHSLPHPHPSNPQENHTGVCLWAPEQHEGCKGFSEPLTLTLGRRCPISQILLVPVTLKKSKQTHKEPERSLCRRGGLWREVGNPTCSKVKPGAYWVLAGAAQVQGTLGLNCSLHTPAGPKSSLTSSGILGHLQCMRIHTNLHTWMHASIHTQRHKHALHIHTCTPGQGSFGGDAGSPSGILDS